MRKSVITIFLLLTTSLLFAQYKVLEKSEKRVPAWVNQTEQEYIIRSSIRGSLEEAKKECLDIVKRNIIELVAQNITSSSSVVTNKATINQSMEFKEEFNSHFIADSARLPFLKSISANKVTNSYWEKRLDKESKQIFYFYSIKYPFFQRELQTLVKEFNETDNEYNEKYLALKEELKSIESIAQIDNAMIEIQTLIDYFFDPQRRNLAIALKSTYKELYNNIRIQEISNELGCYKYCLLLNGAPIPCAKRATITSNEAAKIELNQDSTENIITYAYDHCEPELENSVTIRYHFNNRALNKTFYFRVEDKNANIWPKGNIIIKAREITVDSLLHLAIMMNISNINRKPVTIDSLSLTIPGLAEPIQIGDINLVLYSSDYNLKLNSPKSIAFYKLLDRKITYLKGSLFIRKNGSEKVATFTSPFIPNW